MVKIVILFLACLSFYFVCLSVESMAESAGYDFTTFHERLSLKENWQGSDWPFIKAILWMGAANFTVCIMGGFKNVGRAKPI